MLIKTLALTLALPALVASHGHTGPSYDKDLGYWPEEVSPEATGTSPQSV